MSCGKLQLNLLARFKQDFENFGKADAKRLQKMNYLQTRLEMIERSMQLADKYNEEIVGAGKVEEGCDEKVLAKAYDSILEIYADYRTAVMDAMDKLRPKDDPSTAMGAPASAPAENHRHDTLRLPKINLPTFSGGYESWRSFHDMFISLVHTNTSLSEVQKLHYLKSSVNGEAERLLQHLVIDKNNYQKAWEILVERYDHKRVLVNTQLNLFFSQPSFSTESAANIKRILDTSQEIFHSLENLKVPVDQWDTIIIFIMLQKISKVTQQLWEEKLGSKKDLPTLKEFFDFLRARFRALEAVEQQAAPASSNKDKVTQVFHAKDVQSRDVSCRVCHKGQHALRECKRFLQMDVGQRRHTVYNVKVCENCLAYSHFKQRCPSPKCCYYCKQRHHSLLHDNSPYPHTTTPAPHTTPTQSNTSQRSSTQFANTNPHTHSHTYQVSTVNPNAAEFQPPQSSNSATNYNVTTFHINTDAKVLLATALVRVESSGGGFLTLRALIDPGSEASFITETAVQRLNLKAKRTFVEINGLGRVSSGTAQKIVDLEIRSLTSDFAGKMRALVFKSLTGLLPTHKVNFEKWPYLNGLQLADPTFNIPAKVDMLLGSDIYSDIILGDVVRGSECLGPIAQKTQLGWILLGKVPLEVPRTVQSFVNQLDLDATLRKFWEIEEAPYEKCEAEEDKKCEDHFRHNTKRLPDGRYQVCLPFKGGKYPSMGPTREGAVKRFMQLEKRLQNNPAQHKEYSKCMSEYLQLGHMTQVEESYDILKTPYHFFIPHHAVIKESSTTTKLRVVFDATFKPFFGSSLNDKLMVGPKVQTNVIDIILRWRKYKFTFTGDVEKMYRQIRVDIPDANYQLIFWREHPSQDLKIYRLETVTFGTASAPFLAIRVLLKLADDEASNFPLATSIIKEETYVDDVITGADTVKEAVQKLKAVSDLLATAGFHLRKFVSNSAEVLQHTAPEHREIDFSIPFAGDCGIKTLGIKWQPISDTFSFQVTRLSDDEVTKRSILSSISRLYDPMGWISPCTIKAKIIMQQLWGRGLEWDKPIPSDLKQEWIAFRDDLPSLEKLQIPRWINTDRHNRKIEVHGFSDASEKAYAAAVYLRVLDQADQVHMHLLMSKTKVAPLETITLPRLELCGAVLLAKLLHETTQVLRLGAVDVWAWTDSVITLCWIRAPPAKWKTFICNRVSQVQKLTGSALWRHIPSELNPADLASRGSLPSKIIKNELWWQGPEFLRHQWDAPFPEQPSCLETQQEARPIKVHCGTVEKEGISFMNHLLAKFSSLSRAIRVVAYCLRFRRNTGALRGIANVLSPEELEEALTRIVSAIQREMFAPEEEKDNTRGYKSLNPFRDGCGILRVGGRLANSELPFQKRHPILLKSDHKIAGLIIKDAHEKTLHGGNHKVIAYIRQRFWMFNIKNAVKKHIHACTICYRFRAKPVEQLMGNLPSARTTISRPFTYSGVDYAGPIDVKAWRGRNAKVLKGYFAIFVCMATKAVHIELVSDMTTQAFLSAFRRFVSRRGLCRELFSDCGRNFIGGDSELRRQLREAKGDWKTVAESLANEGTRWKFIPPASPHFGGLWEAGVKSVKFHLKRVAGNQCLTFEELTTLLTQIEACLNSRPLCPQSDDVNDMQPITPGHFLVGEPLIAPPQPEYDLDKISHLDRWKRVQTLLQSFWKQWSNEYLSRLQQRPKWTKVTPLSINVGDLVLIKDERLPPLKWSLARVTTLHPGPDNLVRVVTLKTDSSVLKRPITKLCPLPSNKTPETFPT